MDRRAVMDYLRMRDRRRSGVDYGYRDYRSNDYAERNARNDYAYNSQRDYQERSRDYEQNSRRDMGTRYPFNVEGEFGRYDGHYPYYGQYPMMNDYESRGGRDYNYDYRRDYRGDYGETLNRKEIEKWNKKLMKEVEEKDKQFFSKEHISNKARNMGISFDKYNEEELAVATAMMYTDYCNALKPFVGANMDVYIKLADAFLNDKDASVKGGEKLAVYHDCIVEDKEEDDD